MNWCCQFPILVDKELIGVRPSDDHMMECPIKLSSSAYNVNMTFVPKHLNETDSRQINRKLWLTH